MARRHISQEEAHRLARRVAELEEFHRTRSNQWMRDYPGGTHIETIELGPEQCLVLETVKRLEHLMVAKFDGKAVLVYAINPHKPLQK